MPKSKILIVEDEMIVALELKETLKKLGYEVVGRTDNGEDALTLAEKDEPDLVLMDIRIKGEMDGIDTAGVLLENFNIPVIFLTAHSDNETLRRAIHTQPYGYLVKPFNERALYSNIEMALHKHQIRTKFQQEETATTKGGQTTGSRVSGDGEIEFFNQKVLDSISDPVFLVNGNLRLMLYNKAFYQLCRFMGFRSFKLNQPVHDILPSSLIGTPESFEEIFTTGKSQRMDKSFKIRDMEFSINVDRIPKSHKDAVIHVTTVIHDVTQESESRGRSQKIISDFNVIKESIEGIAGLSSQIKEPLHEIIKLSDVYDNPLSQKIALQKIGTNAEKIWDLVSEIDVKWLKYQQSRKYLDK